LAIKGTENPKEKRSVWKVFTSMNTAIFLLFVLGAAASLGTLIPQGEAEVFYVKVYGDFLGKGLVLCGMDNIYSAWWFLALGALLCLNLLLCSVKRICKVTDWRSGSFVGSILIHLSMLVVVAGAIISALTAVNSYLDVAVGESKDLSAYGFNGYTLSVSDFVVEYYADGTPSQYICSLLITGPGGKNQAERIMVNHPLRFEGIKIYQQSYGWQISGNAGKPGTAAAFQLKEGEAFALDLEKGTSLQTIFVPDFDEQTQSLKSKSPKANNPVLAAAVLQGNQLLDAGFLAPGESALIGGYSLEFTDYRYFSGLRIKKDPGTKVVFAGFFLMTFGFISRYFLANKSVKAG
jgi:cytochrome c biogenesis protein